MATNEETNAAGTDTRPPMLVESDYESWKIRIHRYIRGKPNGKLIWKSIQNGPTPHPMITDPPTTDSAAVPAPREKLDSEFSEEENKLEMADTQAEIILSQGLPRHIFNNLNQTSTAKEIWDNVEMLMQGSGRTIQQRKEDLFDSDRTTFLLLETYQSHGFQKQFPPTNNQLRTSSNSRTHATVHDGQMLLKPVQWKAPGNNGNTGTRGNIVLDTEAQNVPTEVSADTSDKVSMIAILTDLQTQLDGHAKIPTRVKLDLENIVIQEQALVIQRNKRNAELVQENDLLKVTLSGKEKSIAFLQSKKEKILSEKEKKADTIYLEEIVV
ncbi:hypothetical protein Tco_1548276 [Tanacetum coccineum]